MTYTTLNPRGFLDRISPSSSDAQNLTETTEMSPKQGPPQGLVLRALMVQGFGLIINMLSHIFL